MKMTIVVLNLLLVTSILRASDLMDAASAALQAGDATSQCQSVNGQHCQRNPEMLARDFVVMVLDGTYDRTASTVQQLNAEVKDSSELLAEARERVLRENSAGRPSDIIAALLVTPTSLNIGTISQNVKLTEAITLFVTEAEKIK